MATYTIRQIEKDVKQVYKLIEKYPYATANEISRHTNKSYIYTRKIIRKLVKEGKVLVSGRKIKKYILNFDR